MGRSRVDASDGVRVRLGTYRQRVTLSRPDATETTGFAVVASNVPAAIVTKPANAETLAAGGPLALGSRLATMHYRTDIRADWILTDQESSQVLQVVGYGDIEGKRRELQLTCTVLQ